MSVHLGARFTVLQMLRRSAAVALGAVGCFVGYNAPDVIAHWHDVELVDVESGSIFDFPAGSAAATASGAAAAADGSSRDCYEAALARRSFPGGDSPGFTREGAQIEVARAFFSAPIFTLERALIAASQFRLPDPVDAEMFHVGRKLELWEVVLHRPHGISLQWGEPSSGRVWGTTNFAVRRGPTAGHMTVRFGSTLQGAGGEIPAVMAAFHHFYSHVLLAQALANLERRAAVATAAHDEALAAATPHHR